jgi:hypothetical protein
MKGWENVSGIVINSEIDIFVALGGWEVFCCWDTTGVSSLQLISTHARAREVVVASYSNIVSGMALLMSLSKLTSSTNRGRGCLQWKDLHLEDLCIIYQRLIGLFQDILKFTQICLAHWIELQTLLFCRVGSVTAGKGMYGWTFAN